MTALLDSSVLVAAVVQSEAHHEACHALLEQRGLLASPHALAETFNTLTSGRNPVRLRPELAAQVIEVSLLPALTFHVLDEKEVMAAIRASHRRGIRGGAIYDFLHLATARKAKASRLYTLNTSHFLAFHRKGDPDIVHP